MYNGKLLGHKSISCEFSGEVFFTIILKHFNVDNSSDKRVQVFVSTGESPRDSDSAVELQKQPYASLVAPGAVSEKSGVDLDVDGLDHQSEVTLRGNATWSPFPSAIAIGGKEGAGYVCKMRPLDTGPGARFTVSLGAELKAEDACLWLLLLPQGSSHAECEATFVEMQLGKDCAEETHCNSQETAERHTRRSVAVVVRRHASSMTVELRALGRLRGKPVEVNTRGDQELGSVSVCVEYIEGFLAVYAMPGTCGPIRAVGAVGSMAKTWLLECIDLCAELAGVQATMSVCCPGTEREASVLRHCDVCTFYAHAGIMCPVTGSQEGFATQEETLASMLSALGGVAQIDGVRDELDDPAWQDMLWSVCRDDGADVETREKALRLALGGLLQPRDQVQGTLSCNF
jgi:hypothetical protein